MHTVVSVKKPVGVLGSGGTTKRNGSVRRRTRCDRGPAAGSSAWGSVATSISLVVTAEPSERLGRVGRIGDRICHDGSGQGQRRERTGLRETTGSQLADEGFGAVDVCVGVEGEQ